MTWAAWDSGKPPQALEAQTRQAIRMNSKLDLPARLARQHQQSRGSVEKHPMSREGPDQTGLRGLELALRDLAHLTTFHPQHEPFALALGRAIGQGRVRKIEERVEEQREDQYTGPGRQKRKVSKASRPSGHFTEDSHRRQKDDQHPGMQGKEHPFRLEQRPTCHGKAMGNGRREKPREGSHGNEGAHGSGG